MEKQIMDILVFAKDLLAIPSPSGYSELVIPFIKKEAEKLGFPIEFSKKGNAIITVQGKSTKVLGLSGHVDTLGAMVKSISSDGTLRFTTVGGPIWPTMDGEYCTVHTRDNKEFSATFLSTSPSSHVYKDATSKERTPSDMMIRIDEVVHSKDDVLKLGIRAGDFVFFDPKTVITGSGYIKSRFLDDKISVAILFGLLKQIKEENIIPESTLKIIISTYEEVGHGAASVPELDEFIAVDMGCIGDDLTCTEEMVSICAKDSSGPYDYEIISKLVDLAKKEKLDFATDIYPYYGSDVSAAYRGGNDFKGGLIGPGVHASHGMERTHASAVNNTLKLLLSYIQKK
ncbi:MAG: M42 family metallopeptidase [Firmicutes bacterium]|nr:M42 family metallopeptidase [Bacillota bacterium]